MTLPAPAAAVLHRIAAIGNRSLGALAAAVRFVVVVTMAAMVAVVSAQVFLRYGFNTSLDWGEDMARMLFVWTMFLAIPLGVKEGAHIGIELVVKLFPVSLQRALTRIMASLAGVLMATICWQAALLVIDQWDENLPTLTVSTALFMVPVCIGAALSILYLCPSIVTGIAARSAGSAE
jgi:TRAP-type C4-dicarboxylate transport system permease small subunit